MSELETLGLFLRTLRKQRGQNQIEFAKCLDISPSHLCDIEKGRKTVSVERAARFAVILKLDTKLLVKMVLQEQVHGAGLGYTVACG